MLELLMVVAVIMILAGVALPVFNGIVKLANTSHTVNGLKNMVNAVGLWSADNGGKIPSPIYPGGHVGQLPEYHDIGAPGGEPGMWLNGVVYATIMLGLDNMKNGDSVMTPPNSDRAVAGDHLVGTIFESKVSIKAFPEEKDWYRHTYAMNANLQYDEINDLNGSSDPFLTEKDISKFNQPKAMIFIDCIESNVLYAGDADLLIDAADRRYEGKYLIAAFLDGSVRKLPKRDIPVDDPGTDPEAWEFWLGTDFER